jgi:glutamyl-tRNA synthetase
MGYLPAALRNYLVRLGWSHGDQEIFSTDEMIAAFDLKQIGRSPARFDVAKLDNLNGHYIRHTPDEELVDALETILPEHGPPRGLGERFPPDLRERLVAAMPGLKERAKTLVELLDNASFLYASRPLQLDPKAAEILGNGGRERVAGVLGKLERLSDWNAESTEGAVRAYAEQAGVKLGQVAQPLRAALTGKTTSPGLFDVMNVLGRSETLARLKDQVSESVA